MVLLVLSLLLWIKNNIDGSAACNNFLPLWSVFYLFWKSDAPQIFFIENIEKYINSDGQTVLIKLNI